MNSDLHVTKNWTDLHCSDCLVACFSMCVCVLHWDRILEYSTSMLSGDSRTHWTQSCLTYIIIMTDDSSQRHWVLWLSFVFINRNFFIWNAYFKLYLIIKNICSKYFVKWGSYCLHFCVKNSIMEYEKHIKRLVLGKYYWRDF